MRQRVVLATGAAATVLVVAACGAGGSQQAADDTASPSGSAPSSTAATSATPTEGSSSTPPSTPSDTGKRPPSGRISTECEVQHVRADIRPRDSAAGTRYAWLVLTNTSDTTCTVYGYGGMQLYASDGDKVPTNLVRDRSESPKTLRVPPGGSVRSLLKWSVVPHEGEGASGPCQQEASVARVTPPDQTHTVRTTWSFGPVCNSGRILQQPYRGTEVRPGE